MIFYATPQDVVVRPVAAVVAEHAVSPRIFRSVSAEHPPIEIGLGGYNGDSVTSQPQVVDVPEEFDWSKPRVLREYIRLEQRTLAAKASTEETRRYQAMKHSRNCSVFADRIVRDYAEVQRLKLLSEKLAEIQQYLRPFEI
jgi:hypothetical protein